MIRFSRLAGLVVYRLNSTIRSFRWVIVGGSIAILSIADLFFDVPVEAVAIAALLALVLVVLDIRANRKAWKSTSFPPRDSESFRSVTSQLDKAERYDAWEYPNGSFVHDRTLSGMISGGLLASRSESPYVLPPALDKIGKRYLEDVLSRQHNKHHNGPIMGWASNIENIEALHEVKFVPSTYYLHIASDHLATVDVEQDKNHLNDYGRRLFINRHQKLRDFGDSWLLNGVGVSTLAFTADGMLLLIKQSKNNINSGELFAPSGSGALEPVDFKGSAQIPLRKLAENGGNRELTEESTVRASEISFSQFLGFGRWLNKAGRPELFTLALLSVDSHTLRARPANKDEKLYVTRQEFVRLVGHPSTWNPATPDEMLPAHRDHLSVPLAASLSLLAQKWRAFERLDETFFVNSAQIPPET